jgi:uncharacterized phage-associated protein
MSSMSEPNFGGNAVLMLSLVSKSSEKGWLGITKLQKLSFLTEYFLAQKAIRAFGYEFFMYDHGPISKGVYNDYESLLDEQLLLDDEKGIYVSPAGKCISEQFEKAIPEEIKTVVQQVANEYAHLKTHELRRVVHNMRICLPSGAVVKVDDIGRGCTVLSACSKNTFTLGANYSETFAIMANGSLMRAIRVARKKGSTCSPYQSLSTP